VSETQGMRLLREHVERFNQGVERGDFGRMLDAFSDDAVMAFEGIPVGPFHGRAAIAAAYRERPPDGRIQVLHAAEPDPGSVVATYAWVDGPAAPAGELRLRHRDGCISGLVVTYDAAATGDG
jgi:steroid Delta-isomerase